MPSSDANQDLDPQNTDINSHIDPEYDGPDRRQTVVDRRNVPRGAGSANTPPNGLERRRGAGVRRPEFNKSAEEGEMNPEQFLFVKAIDAFKRANDRPYPTWTEVLEVIRKLGYRKTQPMRVQITGAEDWQEAPDAPAFKAIAQDEAQSLDANAWDEDAPSSQAA